MLKVIEASPKTFGERIMPDISVEEIAESVLRDGTVFCIKHALQAASIDRLRQEVFSHYSDVPQVMIRYDDDTVDKNYHSIERGVSRIQKTQHYFHAYVFNKIEALSTNLQTPLHGMFLSLAMFYNELTGQERPLTGFYSDGKKFRPQLFQYPRGGGMFAAHSHALEPQKLGLILGLSKRGRDFEEGGAGFEAPDGTVIDANMQDIGDILIFRYDLKHWVTPCDIHRPLDVARNDGRWSAVFPIY